MTHGSLFSGIGGFDLAAEWMGWDNKFHCEWNEFGQKVLKYYWPNAELFTDITKSDFTKYADKIDVLTGGFPCQPYSLAGKRLGKEDDRHLWPEMLRAIREIEPRWVVGENVFGLVNWNGGLVFNEVQADLEAEGYEVFPYVLPAASVGAPHKRDRIFFVAYSNCNGQYKEWGYDRSSQNAIGCENKKFRTTNSENINRCDTDGDIERQYGINDEIGIERIDKENETTDTNRIYGMDKINREQERGSEKTEFEYNESGALVQERQKMVQLSDNRRLGTDKEILQSSRGIELQNDFSRKYRLERDVKNTNGFRQERGMHPRKPENAIFKQFGKSDARSIQSTSWDNFPTQSPLCNGDDGLSERLDSITFPKWRNESIKAGGNAIVPQVAYQIFNAINQYENSKL